MVTGYMLGPSLTRAKTMVSRYILGPSLTRRVTFSSWRRLRVWILLICFVQLFAGCGSKPVEEEHEEHFPKHWPKTIFVASERLEAIHSQAVNESSNPEITLEQEWYDLVKWLPELAADSDLSEQDFNEIDSVSLRLLSEWQSSKTLPSLGSIRSQSNVEQFLRRLHEICALEQARLNQERAD